MTIRYHTELLQGSDEWVEARRGLLTASEMELILTPTLKPADNKESRTHLWELLAQRISGFVEAGYEGYDQMRGHQDEASARDLYADRYAPVTECGFVTNDRWGFTIGCSPDGLVGDDGMIECKSRKQKYQVQTLIENVGEGTIPKEFTLQVQTALLVTERKWLDFISYSGGLPMATVRVEPDPVLQEAIIKAATAFEEKLAEKMAIYRAVEKSGRRLLPTERRIEEEMHT